MLGQKAAKALGSLAADVLTIGRGEQLRKPPRTQPHHQTCAECGFERWDGYKEHRWGGKAFAQRLCFGPTKAPSAPAPHLPVNPLVEELRAYATNPDTLTDPEPLEPPAPDPLHGFAILGDARDP